MSRFFNISSKLGGKTKPKRSNSAVRSLFLCQPYCNNSIVKGNFKTIVQLPKYVDINEWLAVNVFDFYNFINMFYGSVSDFCTARDCPNMSAGAGSEYLWMDGQKKSSKVPAQQYIDFVMSWIQTLINDENTFPTKDGHDFPPTFQQTVRAIFKQLIRVFAHVYHSHYDKMLALCQEGHFNSLFAHFVSFGREFDLLDKKDIVHLQDLIDIMENNGILC
ncbi:Maintenance of ploidy protein mob2 [Dissophora globulifera]|uniref:Maintenance of ploidy protein mob2 n=1 Tax=Dissophora globulifera TaxID=979702 RepID=A0A9P6R9N2_9FUNG|nr:Maintenance of ploidy protein mob2 [Dissophora globulifera]